MYHTIYIYNITKPTNTTNHESKKIVKYVYGEKKQYKIELLLLPILSETVTYG